MITLSAEDMDAPGSPNSHIVYQLLSPEHEEGAQEKAFELDSTSGSVTLGTAPLHAGQDFLLQVLAVDLAGSEGGKYPASDLGPFPSVPTGTSPTIPPLHQASAAHVRWQSRSQTSTTMPLSSSLPR